MDKENVICKYVYMLCYAKLLQSCLTLWDSEDCSLPGSSVHEILQARVLECVAIPNPGISHTAGRCFTFWATRDRLCLISFLLETSWHQSGSSVEKLLIKDIIDSSQDLPVGKPGSLILKLHKTHSLSLKMRGGTSLVVSVVKNLPFNAGPQVRSPVG